MSPGYGHSVVQSLLILDPVAVFYAEAAGALILTAVEVSIMNHKWGMHFDPLTWCTPRLVLDNWYVPLTGAMCTLNQDVSCAIDRCIRVIVPHILD